ncbi:MAG: SUMF1/EgtB/PvdO family nonheme iron enzyme [bacterium]
MIFPLFFIVLTVASLPVFPIFFAFIYSLAVFLWFFMLANFIATPLGLRGIYIKIFRYAVVAIVSYFINPYLIIPATLGIILWHISETLTIRKLEKFINDPTTGIPVRSGCLKDGSELILIPAGEFTMGSPQGEGSDNEHPQHNVYLDVYYIGKHEVTNKQFAKFVQETGYQARWPWRDYYNLRTAAHPVISVTWNDAKAYCEWAGLRLPTEAEWEKAARGTDGRNYPWGNEWDERNCNCYQGPKLSRIANISQGRGTLPVGSFPLGASPYGCLDMAGNVDEWCSDWYGEKYYGNSPQRNPQGPGSGSDRVLRGGSWNCCFKDFFRAAFRSYGVPNFRSEYCGFRVARS